MEEKRMLELADRLVELKESKAATEAQLSAIIGDIEAVQEQLVAIMTEQECSGFKRGNHVRRFTFKDGESANKIIEGQTLAVLDAFGMLAQAAVQRRSRSLLGDPVLTPAGRDGLAYINRHVIGKPIDLLPVCLVQPFL